MTMRAMTMAAALLVSACASTQTAPDATLASIQHAQMRSCPPERTQADAQSAGFGERRGVESVDLGIVPSSDDPTRALRLRRLTVAPGGVIAWHDHTDVQGVAMIISGEATELRNTCLDPITYHAGDMALEHATTAHSWRNDGTAPAIFLVAHIIRP
jgi:quercetin dioxygenase-like cupin family protein